MAKGERPKQIEMPLLTCGRCNGSGMVTVAQPGGYDVEDAAPRELPVQTCPTCGGMGQVRAKERSA